MSSTLPLAALADIEDKGLFIETGSHNGDGINIALAAGYKRVISIENQDKFYQRCLKKFGDNSCVTLMFGNSQDILPEILDELNEQATFWLDAHIVGTEQPVILKELDELAARAFNTHTLLIDDMRLIRNGETWGKLLTLKDLELAVRRINPLYSITYIPNTIAHDDILKATI